MKKLSLALLPSLLLLAGLAACERQSNAAAFPDDKERLKAAAEAAAEATQAITQKLAGTYGTNQAINVHVQVGDIVVLGFDEGIDAEEWGMTEYSSDAPQGSPAAAQAAAIKADQAPATASAAGKRKIARSIDLRKGSIYLVAAEESEAEAEETIQKPATPEPVKKDGR